jgi:hypothetical protein
MRYGVALPLPTSSPYKARRDLRPRPPFRRPSSLARESFALASLGPDIRESRTVVIPRAVKRHINGQ